LAIKVNLIGGLRALAGRSQIRLEFKKTGMTVSETIFELCRKIARKEFERALIDPAANGVGSNVIVLVNNREISALEGSKTQIRHNDAITLVPVAHGG